MTDASKTDTFLVAALTEDEIKKLVEVEQHLNRTKGGARKTTVYLIAYCRQ